MPMNYTKTTATTSYANRYAKPAAATNAPANNNPNRAQFSIRKAGVKGLDAYVGSAWLKPSKMGGNYISAVLNKAVEEKTNLFVGPTRGNEKLLETDKQIATGSGTKPQFTVKEAGKTGKEAYCGSAWFKQTERGNYLAVVIDRPLDAKTSLFISPTKAAADILG